MAQSDESLLEELLGPLNLPFSVDNEFDPDMMGDPPHQAPSLNAGDIAQLDDTLADLHLDPDLLQTLAAMDAGFDFLSDPLILSSQAADSFLNSQSKGGAAIAPDIYPNRLFEVQNDDCIDPSSSLMEEIQPSTGFPPTFADLVGHHAPVLTASNGIGPQFFDDIPSPFFSIENISLPLLAMNPTLDDSFVPTNRIIELPDEPSESSPVALDSLAVQPTQPLSDSESRYKRAEDIQLPPPPMKKR
jgi:hypothetical protein